LRYQGEWKAGSEMALSSVLIEVFFTLNTWLQAFDRQCCELDFCHAVAPVITFAKSIYLQRFLQILIIPYDTVLYTFNKNVL
jgi:hypothetical protein